MTKRTAGRGQRNLRIEEDDERKERGHGNKKNRERNIG